MVVRKRKGTPNSDTYSLHLSYGEADVKAKLKERVIWLKSNFGSSYTFHTGFSEQEFLTLFSVIMFKEYADKYQQELALWAFRLSVKKGLIIKSANAENRYYFAESLGVRMGRPPENAWEWDADLRENKRLFT